MKQHAESPESTKTLYLCGLRDLKGRLKTLQLELRHLQQTCAMISRRQDIFKNLATEDRLRCAMPTEEFCSPSGGNPESQRMAHTTYLIRSAQEIKCDIDADLSLVRALRDGSYEEIIRAAFYVALKLFDDRSEGLSYTFSSTKDEIIEGFVEQFLDQLRRGAKNSSSINSTEIEAYLSSVTQLVGVSLEGPEEASASRQQEVVKHIVSVFCNSVVNVNVRWQERIYSGIRDEALYSAEAGPEIYRNVLRAVLRQRTRIYAEQVGLLHHRLGQYVEQTRVTQALPSVRRRQENYVTDRFLNELVRWVHRDLILLVRDVFNCDIREVHTPPTFQYWEYAYSSTYSQYASDHCYSDWKERTYGLLQRSGDTRQQAVTNGLQDASRPDEKSGQANQEGFRSVHVRHSFWIHDRASMTPIMGHELAHSIIERTIGTYGNTQLLENKALSGLLGDLFRRITSVYESATVWFGGYEHVRTEILSDIIAATKFGHAYLYAWAIDTFDDENLASAMRDEFDRFSPTDPIWSPARAIYNGLLESEVPEMYLRGRALLAWIAATRQAASRRNHLQTELEDAVRHHLRHLLDLYCGGNPRFHAHWDKAGAALEIAVRKSRAAEKVRDYLSRVIDGDTRADLWFWRRQELGRELKDAISRVAQHESAADSLNNVCDVPWVLEWTSTKRRNPPPHQSRQCANKSDIAFYHSLAMEEYLANVDNPYRHLSQCYAKSAGEIPEDFSLQAETNSLDPEDYALRWNHCDRVCEERSANSSVDIRYSGAQVAELFNLSQDAGSEHCFDRLDIVSITPTREAPLIKLLGGQDVWQFSPRPFVSPEKAHSISVLGAYDRCILTLGTTPVWEGAWERVFSPSSRDRPNEPATEFAPYVSRRRLLKRVSIPSPASSSLWLTEEVSSVSIVLLVGLCREHLRLRFASWLAGRAREDDGSSMSSVLRNWDSAVYLSNGWEDFVLVLRVPAVNPSDQTVWAASDIVGIWSKLVNELYAHPYVVRTESMLPTGLLEYGDSAAQNPRFSFLVRMENQDNETGFKLKASLAEEGIHDVIVSNRPGSVDYVVELSHQAMGQARKTRNALLNMPDVSRLQSSVGHII